MATPNPSTAPEVGRTVETPDGEVAVVRSAPRNSGRRGRTVRVEYLPVYQRGRTPAQVTASLPVADLRNVRVCECSLLGFVDRSGELRTTRCNLDRAPSRGRRFLPGHDAKAKGLLIDAWDEDAEMLLGMGHPSEVSQRYGFDYQVRAAILAAAA